MKISSLTRLVAEGVVKTAVMLYWLWWFSPQVREFAKNVPRSARTDELMFIGLLLAGAVAGTFQFSYRNTDVTRFASRLLGHLTTGTLMFGIGLLMEIAYYIMKQTYGLAEGPIETAIVVVFLSIILYDFWDIVHCVMDDDH